MSPINTPAWLDKSLWVGVLGFLLPILNRKYNLGLEAADIYAALSPLLTFIALNKWKTTTLHKAELAANTAGEKVATAPPANVAATINQ